MAEVITPVESVRVDYACDVEGCTGKMYVTEEGKSIRNLVHMEVMTFEHQCNICGVKKSFDKHYPAFGYRDKIS